MTHKTGTILLLTLAVTFAVSDFAHAKDFINGTEVDIDALEDAASLCKLGMRYHVGLDGHLPDYMRAAEYYLKATLTKKGTDEDRETARGWLTAMIVMQEIAGYGGSVADGNRHWKITPGTKPAGMPIPSDVQPDPVADSYYYYRVGFGCFRQCYLVPACRVIEIDGVEYVAVRTCFGRCVYVRAYPYEKRCND